MYNSFLGSFVEKILAVFDVTQLILQIPLSCKRLSVQESKDRRRFTQVIQFGSLPFTASGVQTFSTRHAQPSRTCVPRGEYLSDALAKEASSLHTWDFHEKYNRACSIYTVERIDIRVMLSSDYD